MAFSSNCRIFECMKKSMVSNIFNFPVHEEKKGESVFFKPVCHRFSEQIELLAHRVLNADQILKVSMVEFAEGKTIDIF